MSQSRLIFVQHILKAQHWEIDHNKTRIVDKKAYLWSEDEQGLEIVVVDAFEDENGIGTKSGICGPNRFPLASWKVDKKWSGEEEGLAWAEMGDPFVFFLLGTRFHIFFRELKWERRKNCWNLICLPFVDYLMW